jgi:DNA polymerase-3 subunit delta
MSVLNAKNVLAQIRKEPLQNFYYFYGADLLQVENLTEQVIQVATNGQPETALTKLDGKKLDLQALEDAAQMFSMFAPYNCILITDCNADSFREPALKQLMAVLERISGVTVLIFQITGFDVKDGKRSISGKNKKLVDWIAKNGVVCEAVPPTLSEMVRQLCSQAKQQGCTLSERGAEEIIHRCNGDTLMIRSELEKLCACAEQGEIPMTMIQDLVIPTVSATTFALASAIVQQRSAAAMRELEQLFALRIERPVMLAALVSSFLDLYRAAAANRQRISQADMKQDFGYRFDFQVRNAFRDCRRIPIELIQSCLSILRDLEKNCNSTTGSERVAIETAVIRMLTMPEQQEYPL